MFQGTWNGLFWPAVLLQDRAQYTIPIALAFFRQIYQTQWPPLMAASVLAIVPILAPVRRVPALLRRRASLRPG